MTINLRMFNLSTLILQIFLLLLQRAEAFSLHPAKSPNRFSISFGIHATRDDEVAKGEKIMESLRLKKEAKKQRMGKVLNSSPTASKGKKFISSSSTLSSQLRDKRSKKKGAKQAVKSRPINHKRSEIDFDPVADVPMKSFATKTIWGQNIINCRSFSVDSPKTFEFLGSHTSVSSIPVYSIPEIAFLGRSNVGKSSMLNCLTGLNKKIAVESKTPGRTQCINLFNCRDKEGDICIFVDLPGYGFAKMSKVQQDEVSSFLRQYLSERGSLKLAVLLIDARREPQTSDREMISFLLEEGLPFIVVATKCDKISGSDGVRSGMEISKSLSALSEAFGLPPNQPVAFSSITGLGRKDIWKAIQSGILGQEDEEDGEDGEDEEEDIGLNYDDF